MTYKLQLLLLLSCGVALRTTWGFAPVVTPTRRAAATTKMFATEHKILSKQKVAGGGYYHRVSTMQRLYYQ